MNNLERYDQVFCETLSITKEQLEGLNYQGVPLWDSVGHMALIAALEEAYDIMMETDDIIAFSSYEEGKKILTVNYEVEF